MELENYQGTVFNIQKFCINDGPGIRTTVFMKGCPLSCQWCHNPESQSVRPEIFFDDKKCTRCGRCVSVCPNQCHIVSAQEHRFDRSRCVGCGACAEACFNEALECAGKTMSAGDVFKEVMKDEIFYQTSGGGMTLSGGEPLAQFAFTNALLQLAAGKKLHTCIETCGFAPEEHLRQIAPLVGIFLFDYKVTDPADHKKYTGVSNERILQNLKLLDDLGCKTILRCPIIPTVNDHAGHFAGIANVAESLKNIIEINVEPYHPLGAGKNVRLGRKYAFDELSFPAEETVQEWMEQIRKGTDVPVKKA